MGSQVKAVCSCGHSKNILVGGGLFNHLTIDYFPCYCENCQDVVQGNLKDDGLICPNCSSTKIIPYNNKKLITKKGKKTIAQSFNNVLTDGFYKCPKCKSDTLIFQKLPVHWD